MKWEAGKEYRTRDGKLVRIYATEGGGIKPIHGAIYSKHNARWVITTWSEKGCRYADVPGPDNDDLMPPKIKRWLNIYPSQPLVYATKEEAESNGRDTRLACIEIEYEEGEGLS